MPRTFRTAIVYLLLHVFWFSSPAVAQSGDWDWTVAPYLWAAGISGDGEAGQIPLDIGIETADILNALDGALMLNVRARQESHSFYGDLIWLSLDPEADEGLITGRIDSDLDGLILEAGYSRVFEPDGWSWVAGARYYDIDLRVVPTLLPVFDRGDAWVDGLVGVEYQRPLNDKWNLFVHADVGAGGSEMSYGLVAMFSREFDSGDSFAVGYKSLGIDVDVDDSLIDPFNLDIAFHGLALAWVFD